MYEIGIQEREMWTRDIYLEVGSPQLQLILRE